MDGYTAHDTARAVGEGATARPAFARDRARVLHSAGLRRLAATTQVVEAGELDFPRTRLTHTLEVAQIGRELGAALGCDPDLVDVAGLAHDLGHPPFGHNGEEALDEVCAGIGGFEGNAQTLRVLTRLESKAVDADGRSAGLNLTRAALDAACKYPWPRREGVRKFGVYDDDLAAFAWMREGAPEARRCLESQVMDWADDVAYSVHDLEDAVHGGHFDIRALRSGQEAEELVAMALRRYAGGLGADELRDACRRIAGLPFLPTGFDGSHSDSVALKGLTSRLIGRFCQAAEAATLAAFPDTPLTRYSADLVVPADARAEVAILKAVTARHVMFTEGTEARRAEQRAMLAELVAALLPAGRAAIEPWLRQEYDDAEALGDDAVLRAVVDQVACLTDVSAVVWHRRWCG